MATKKAAAKDVYDWIGPGETAELLRRLIAAGDGAHVEVRHRNKKMFVRVVRADRATLLAADGEDCDDINNSMRCPPICP